MSLPLTFTAPRRGKPPRHLADLSPQEAAEAVAALGEPAFRAAPARYPLLPPPRGRPGHDDRPAGIEP